MHMKLEVVMLPVADVDASIEFYREQVGFSLDHDVLPSEGMRVVQLTPPGSACSIVFGTGLGDLSDAGPVHGLHLVVDDITTVRKSLQDSGVPVSEISDVGGGIRYAYFADPDENSWALQEIASRRG